MSSIKWSSFVTPCKLTLGESLDFNLIKQCYDLLKTHLWSKSPRKQVRSENIK